MPFTPQDIESNRDWFQRKLRAEKEKNTVLHWVNDEPGGGDFLLLDVRSRGGFRKAHIRGALCVPLEELADLVGKLPRDRELVTYCWTDT